MRNDIKRLLIGMMNTCDQHGETLTLEDVLDSGAFQKMMGELNNDEKLEVVQYLEIFFMELEE